MSRDYAIEEAAGPRSRVLLRIPPNAPPDEEDFKVTSFSQEAHELDSQSLLVADGLAEEPSHRRSGGWTNSPSWLRSPRPQRIRLLGGRTAGICYACEKLIPKRRKNLRTLVLLGLGTILALYDLKLL